MNVISDVIVCNGSKKQKSAKSTTRSKVVRKNYDKAESAEGNEGLIYLEAQHEQEAIFLVTQVHSRMVCLVVELFRNIVVKINSKKLFIPMYSPVVLKYYSLRW